jgi:hypothetical protein
MPQVERTGRREYPKRLGLIGGSLTYDLGEGLREMKKKVTL